MNDETTELMPCPFCGSEAQMTLRNIGDSGEDFWSVECFNPECGCDFCLYYTEAEAIAAWNTRADYYGYEQAAIEAWESIKAWNSRAERTCYADEVTHRDCKYSVNRGWKERTCKQEERGWGTEGDHARVWLTCGHDCMVPTVQDLPNYCPNCGCKVIGG